MTTNRTSQFFDSYAHNFAEIYGNENTYVNSLVNRYLRKSMRLRYQKTIEGCFPIEGKSVLDIGCGPGHYSVVLAKRGARHVLGIDFAKTMIDLADQNGRSAGVEDRCRFVCGDFIADPMDCKYDYAIAMGFMDYIGDPRKTVEKILSVTNLKAFFSFPADGGFLAWQRKIRYKKRCSLYMYNLPQLHELFSNLTTGHVLFERIGRDYFVTVAM